MQGEREPREKWWPSFGTYACVQSWCWRSPFAAPAAGCLCSRAGRNPAPRPSLWKIWYVVRTILPRGSPDTRDELRTALMLARSWRPRCGRGAPGAGARSTRRTQSGRHGANGRSFPPACESSACFCEAGRRRHGRERGWLDGGSPWAQHNGIGRRGGRPTSREFSGRARWRCLVGSK